MKGIELKKIEDRETMPENNKAVLKHFNELSKSNKKPSVLTAPITKPSKQPDQVEDLAEELQKKVQFNQLNQDEKIEFLNIKVNDKEKLLRQRTDETLQSGSAFNLVVENQRFFAICQDKYANLSKKQREVIAFNSVREVNELIKQRKSL